MHLTPPKRLPRPVRDEAGTAMIIGISVILVITLLSVTVMTRTLSGLASTKRSQDFQGALGGADSGVSDALFRLDQIGANSPETACPVSDPMPCTITGVPGSPDTTYTMELVDPGNLNHILIRSKGLTNGVPHAVEAIASRSLLYPFAIFGDSNVEFSGAPGGSCAVGTTGCISSWPVDTVTAIGTNGTLKCVPNNPADASFVFPPSAAGACDSTVGTGSYDPKPPTTSCPAPANTPTTPCLPASYNTCPVDSSGVLWSAIPAGVYRCNQQVTFPSVLEPSGGVVQLYVFPPTGVSPFVIGSGYINWSGGAGAGDARNLQIFTDGAGSEITHGSSDDFRFSGVLYAPGMLLRGNGCKSQFNGSIVVDNFDCNGNNLVMNYDSRLTTISDETWTTRDYTEIPSTRVVPV